MKANSTFSTFQDAIESNQMPVETLSYYLELDPDAAVPKLRFKPGVIKDPIPEDYDVDTIIYHYLQDIADRNYENDSKLGPRERTDILAEGDSWFNMPIFIRPPTIADRLNKRSKYNVKNVARWGHTIEDVFAQKEYINRIRPGRTDCLILSAGGNDLQNGLENKNDSIVKRYDPARPINDYLTQKGKDLLVYIDDTFREMISEVITTYPDIRVFCHGYDYPRPLVGKGKYIGKYLRRMEIPDPLMSPIMNPVMDLLNQRISNLCDDHGSNVVYVNCRNVTDGQDWIDDMHPGRDGFKKLAKSFAREIG